MVEYNTPRRVEYTAFKIDVRPGNVHVLTMAADQSDTISTERQFKQYIQCIKQGDIEKRIPPAEGLVIDTSEVQGESLTGTGQLLYGARVQWAQNRLERYSTFAVVGSVVEEAALEEDALVEDAGVGDKRLQNAFKKLVHDSNGQINVRAFQFSTTVEEAIAKVTSSRPAVGDGASGGFSITEMNLKGPKGMMSK